MKYLSIIMILTFGMFADSVNLDIGADYLFSLTYHSSGTHQTAKTISLSIKRASDGYWFDFDDDTFKASGWTTKTVSLTEDSTNHDYYYSWADQGGDTTANHYIFHVECSGEFIQEETVIFNDSDVSSNVTSILNRVNAINP